MKSSCFVLCLLSKISSLVFKILAIAYFPCLILFIFSFFLCNFFIVYLQSVFSFKMNRLIIFHFLSFLIFNFITSKLIISISLFFFMFTFVTYTFLLTFVIFLKKLHHNLYLFILNVVLFL